MYILEDTDELFFRPVLHWEYQDTVSFVFVEDKYVFFTPLGGNWESSREVGCYPLLWIDDLGEDVVGACLQFFHWFVFVLGSVLASKSVRSVP